jgi:hypothetical protein
LFRFSEMQARCDDGNPGVKEKPRVFNWAKRFLRANVLKYLYSPKERLLSLEHPRVSPFPDFPISLPTPKFVRSKGPPKFTPLAP